jgi:hypothetical protein
MIMIEYYGIDLCILISMEDRRATEGGWIFRSPRLCHTQNVVLVVFHEGSTGQSLVGQPAGACKAYSIEGTVDTVILKGLEAREEDTSCIYTWDRLFFRADHSGIPQITAHNFPGSENPILDHNSIVHCIRTNFFYCLILIILTIVPFYHCSLRIDPGQ